MIRYAAYGSNLHPHRLQGRVPSASLAGTAMVDGWNLKFHKRSQDGSGKCNVVASENSVFFALFEIDDSEKSDLDDAEGLGKGYVENHIQIPGFGEYFFYIASESHIQKDLKPYSWYKELVVIGLEYHQAPKQYLQKILAVSDKRDKKDSRYKKNMRIVAEARNGT